MRSRMEGALMTVYKQGNRVIPTPDLTSQLKNIENVPPATTTLYKVYHADWLEDERERVTIKAIKTIQYNAASDKVSSLPVR